MYRVMIADDEPIMRKAMMVLTNWEELDCEVVYMAKNGQEVIENLANANPDILITDIKMPGKDGIEVARYIWEHKLPIKVIILTAYADFSYAQSAVKYNVVEYVTKTGAFDGLVMAVNKAKESLEEWKQQKKELNQKALIENFYKGIFDGSLYESEEIKGKSNELGIYLEHYLVMLLNFRLVEEVDTDRRKKINHSLLNFFSMVFGSQLLYGIPVKKDMFIMVLDQGSDGYKEEIREKCIQIIDMMENFMNLSVYIGISNVCYNILGLKGSYDQAEYSLENGFFDENSKIYFYDNSEKGIENYSMKIDQATDKIISAIGGGDKEKAILYFDELLLLQKENHSNANEIKNSGILIQSKCRKLLSKYEKSIYDVVNFTGSISKAVYECFYAEKYKEIMCEIIKKTADFIGTTVNKKHSLIYECEKYIEENIESNITVSDIAEHVGASPSYLSRIFKESVGNTIIYTLNQKKIEKAKEYLKNTDLKIYEIAEILGFENTTYFSHFFKKHTGIPPKDYK